MRRISSLLCQAVFVCVSICVFSRAAGACSCAPPPSPQESLEKADAVFLGTLERLEFAGETRRVGDGDERQIVYPLIVATFRVVRSWKGPHQPLLQVRTSSSDAACGASFGGLRGKYLVYAAAADGIFSTSLCSRTKRWPGGAGFQAVAEEVEALGPGTPVEWP